MPSRTRTEPNWDYKIDPPDEPQEPCVPIVACERCGAPAGYAEYDGGYGFKCGRCAHTTWLSAERVRWHAYKESD